jgi:succinyldiaminopimelate transaminase
MAFVVPPYPYDRLAPAKAAASALVGGVVDLSIGTPCDPPAPAVIEALGHSGAERGYPTSLGSPAFRASAAAWMHRRLHVELNPDTEVAACIGTKEFVATTPQYLHLLRDDRDTVLYPQIAYPTYEMGALLAGLRPVPVACSADGAILLDTISASDAARALCLWVNTPGNPAGNLDDLGAAAAWGRDHDVWVISDECYVEFTWDGGPRTILSHGLDGGLVRGLDGGLDGVLAVHSLSKRSNLAGVRAGFYAGDRTLVRHLSEVRKHAGFMMPGPVQHAAAVAYDDDAHVDVQRERYRQRLQEFADVLLRAGFQVELPGGGFYLWAEVPGGDSWRATDWLAHHGGALVSPGEFYGPKSTDRIRVAMVQPEDRLELVADRLSDAGRYPC